MPSRPFSSSAASPSISLVGALVVPDQLRAKIEKKYEVLRHDFSMVNGEVKGRLLLESDVAAVVRMLRRNEVIFEVTAIDMGLHKPSDIAAHKRRQEEELTKNLTVKHSLELRTHVGELRRCLERMTHQLYVQSIATFNLVARVIEHATLLYSQRRPQELGAFHWIIDAKDRERITAWEIWWSEVLLGILQSGSLNKPMAHLEGADYSHFERFSKPLPQFLRAHIRGPVEQDEHANSLTMILGENFRFSAQPEPGVEMVDILVNATRRALMGNLGFAGWRDIRTLMIHREYQYIELVSLWISPPASSGEDVTYAPTVRHFSSGGRSMLAPRFRNLTS
jgi:hypothetical protein